MISKRDLKQIKLIKTKNKITIDDEFDLAEQLGRLNFIGWCKATKPCQYVSSNLDKYGEYDVEILWRGEPALVEIKFREGYSSNDFNSWMMESDKLTRLQENKGYKLFYYNLFSDLELAMWDVTKTIPTNIITQELQKNNFTTNTRNKEVFFLNINNAYKTF